MTRAELRPLALSALIAVLAMVGIELALRVVGPTPPSRLPYQRLELPVLRRVGSALATADPRIPYQELPDAADRRIIVFGGSAAAGLGQSPNASFSRRLEELLARDGGRPAVLNLGLVAASSRELRWLVGDVLATTTPDLVVVYTGNNEYLEAAAARYAWATAGPLDRARLLAAGTRLFGLWRDLLVDDGPPIALPRVSGAEMDAAFTLSVKEDRRILDRYERNLRAIVRASDAPVLLATVATNEAWPGGGHRRATPQMTEIVRRVSADEGALLCDIARDADLAGYDAFYDHIHFTPWGAAQVAAALYGCLGGTSVTTAWLSDQRTLPERDHHDVTRWLGTDPDRVRDPDLWKYDALLAELDRRLAADPDDFDALVQRGNACFFEQEGAARARWHWERALALREDDALRSNLERLDRQQRSRLSGR